MAKNKGVYNKFFTEEKWLKVNKYNKDAMEDFLLELKAQKKSDKTIYQYKSDLRIFFIWILETYDNCPIYKLKKKQLRNFVLEMSDKDMSSNRVNRMKSVVSSLFSFLEEDDDYEEIEMNYMSKIKSVQKEMVRDIVFLEDEEIKLIRDELIKREQYQIALLLSLLYDSGCRKNEAFGVMKDWIDVNGHSTKEKVKGKRSKTFYLYYHDYTIEAYKLYMEQRGEDDIKELWINHKGEPASIDALYLWIKYCKNILFELTGKDVELNVHSIRHATATNLSNGTFYMCKRLGKKFELNEIKLLLNHSDISTTDSYIKRNDEEILANAFGWDKN